MQSRDLIGEMSALLEADPTGGLAHKLLLKEKDAGLTKDEAHELLSQLHLMYGDKAYGDKGPETPTSEQIVDLIGELLDGVHGVIVVAGFIRDRRRIVLGNDPF